MVYCYNLFHLLYCQQLLLVYDRQLQIKIIVWDKHFVKDYVDY